MQQKDKQLFVAKIIWTAQKTILSNQSLHGSVYMS